MSKTGCHLRPARLFGHDSWVLQQVGPAGPGTPSHWEANEPTDFFAWNLERAGVTPFSADPPSNVPVETLAFWDLLRSVLHGREKMTLMEADIAARIAFGDTSRVDIQPGIGGTLSATAPIQTSPPSPNAVAWGDALAASGSDTAARIAKLRTQYGTSDHAASFRRLTTAKPWPSNARVLGQPKVHVVAWPSLEVLRLSELTHLVGLPATATPRDVASLGLN